MRIHANIKQKTAIHIAINERIIVWSRMEVLGLFPFSELKCFAKKINNS